MDFLSGVRDASARIRPEVIRTSLQRSDLLSRRLAADVFVKAEYEQPTGSFKLRGATNKLKSLTREEKNRGVVSASTGNHGLAVSRAARLEGASVTLFVPNSLSPDKRTKLLAATGVSLEFVPASCEQAELAARQFGRDSGRVFISPYNDPDVILGQGTAGLEILEELPQVQDVLVPVGGGGLIAGIAGYLKTVRPGIRVIGVEPVNSRFLAESLKAGRLVEVEESPSLADAVAGGLEPGSMTFPLCQKYVDDIITVEESLIAESLALLFEDHGRVVEGAGALALAGLLKDPRRFQGRSLALVASGGNISPTLHRQIVSRA
jgi:threonine dehydratase